MKTLSLRANRGVTLVELMIVIAIVGILVGLVAPNYKPLIAKMTVAAEARRTISMLKQARSEARARGATVTLRRDTNNDWSGPVIIYESTNAAGNADYTAVAAAATVGDDLIKEYPASSRSVTIRDDAVNLGQYISFDLQGWLSSSESRRILLAVCAPGVDTGEGMYIEINRVGKIRERKIGTATGGCL
jgi:prepilin-type N-terminal cleavage/methylation domain-containing protein